MPAFLRVLSSAVPTFCSILMACLRTYSDIYKLTSKNLDDQNLATDPSFDLVLVAQWENWLAKFSMAKIKLVNQREDPETSPTMIDECSLKVHLCLQLGFKLIPNLKRNSDVRSIVKDAGKWLVHSTFSVSIWFQLIYSMLTKPRSNQQWTNAAICGMGCTIFTSLST